MLTKSDDHTSSWLFMPKLVKFGVSILQDADTTNRWECSKSGRRVVGNQKEKSRSFLAIRRRFHEDMSQGLVISQAFYFAISGGCLKTGIRF